MTDKLRELADRWKSDGPGVYSDHQGGVNDARCDCADELLAILDAEGDGGAEPAPEIFHGTRSSLSELSIQPKDRQS